MVEATHEGDAQENVCKKIKVDHKDELNDKISKQIEYYFSDVNVVRDKFLQEEFKKDDGWIKLSVLLTFKKLQQLSSDENRLVQALKDAKSENIELDESKKQIRRKNPIPDIEEYQKTLQKRTVHISGFPTDYSFEQLDKFCTQFGQVESLNMRRHFKTRFFKGCIHVTFTDASAVETVLKSDPLKCKDRELRKESMDEYHKRKAEMAQKRADKKRKPDKADKAKKIDKSEKAEEKETPEKSENTEDGENQQESQTS